MKKNLFFLFLIVFLSAIQVYASENNVAAAESHVSAPVIDDNKSLAEPVKKQAVKKIKSKKEVKVSKKTSKSGTPSKDINVILSKWPKEPRSVAEKLITRYGTPDEYTKSDLTWYHKGPFKLIDVNNRLVKHNYPHPHYDVLEQTINYPVHNIKPPLPCKLQEFNGSLVFDKTKGELTAHCDSEAVNFLLLNLAHEIISGKKTVAEARDFFTKQYVQHAKGLPSKYTSGLLFKPFKEQGQTDEIAPLYEQLMSAGTGMGGLKKSKKNRKTGKKQQATKKTVNEETEFTETVADKS